MPVVGDMEHRHIVDLPDLLEPEDLLVFNNTRVLNARLFAVKDSGGQAEILVERVLDEARMLAQVRVSKALQPSRSLQVTRGGQRGPTLRVLGRQDRFYELESDLSIDELLAEWGQVPLPPYVQRDPDAQDLERYQTVFAREPGAVAAPTAGLHFDEALLDALAARGVGSASITLHVGSGTFSPVKVSNPAEHTMHSEWCTVPAETVAAIQACTGRVVAVGTTCLRALESAAARGTLTAFSGDTQLFVTPGYRFRVVDALVTNFHLPESTLLMLVCALGGTRKVLAAYEQAVRRDYRFFSYGDAMLIERDDAPDAAPEPKGAP